MWNFFMRIWVSIYLRFPNNISVDQGQQFECPEWKSLVKAAGIPKKSSEVERYNALKVREMYYHYRRRIFNQIMAGVPCMQVDLADVIESSQRYYRTIWTGSNSVSVCSAPPYPSYLRGTLRLHQAHESYGRRTKGDGKNLPQSTVKYCFKHKYPLCGRSLI